MIEARDGRFDGYADWVRIEGPRRWIHRRLRADRGSPPGWSASGIGSGSSVTRVLRHVGQEPLGGRGVATFEVMPVAKALIMCDSGLDRP